MFEWLSCSEWCDVRIVCGGSIFNAHRTVLASSSRFLKDLLLSCSNESSPIFIFLPEIDSEAMLSVLYYIYNGEVSIPEIALKKFLEIILTLRIRIDDESSLLIKEQVGDFNYVYEHKIISETDLDNKDVGNDTQEKYITIYERTNSSNTQRAKQCNIILSQDSERNDNSDIQLDECNSEVSKLNDKYRQRQHYLHASFNETYLRNGHVNGQARCVPTIINERYHHPTSQLSTNAKDDVVNYSDNASVTTTLNKLSKETLYYDTEMDDRIDAERESIIYKQNSSDVKLYDLHNIYTEKYYSNEEYSKINEDCPINLRCNLNRNNSKLKPVLNKVLHCPWRSKFPAFYKPFRRKVASAPENLVKDSINDNNNNNLIENETPRNCNDCFITEKTDFHKSSKATLSKPVRPLAPSTSNTENFQCTICHEVFEDEVSLTKHTSTHPLSGKYTCTDCGKCFSQLRNFKYHMSVHRGTREFAATCSVCGKYFNDRGYLSSHMKIHRNRKEYKCSLCPKSFNQRVAYNMHVRIHTGVKPHTCDECGKSFSRKMLLKQHQRTHSGERPYACPHCEKRFADRSNMTLHLRLHTGIKPFTCSYCSKSFTKKHHLKSHLNFHTGDKPYSCPQCNVSFTQSSNMRTHLKKCNVSDVNSKNK